MHLSPGKIFLADDRGQLENEVHQRFSTFNFAEYQSEHKSPFANLFTFNDETLPAAGTLWQADTINGFMLLIPITGAVVYQHQSQQYSVEAGQVLLVPVSAGSAFRITNPYASNWVNFLHAEIKAEELTQTNARIFNFDIEDQVNQLISVISDIELPFSLHIGRFAGRMEVLHQLFKNQQVFAFVIGGAFELQNRLLHQRDGLALWHTTEVEAEALSENAVLLLLELESTCEKLQE